MSQSQDKDSPRKPSDLSQESSDLSFESKSQPAKQQAKKSDSKSPQAKDQAHKNDSRNKPTPSDRKDAPKKRD